MKEKEKNKRVSTKKIMRIINIFTAIWSIILVTLYTLIRVKSNMDSLLLAFGLGFAFVGGLILFQKILEHSKLKEALEEANRECEEEESNKKATDEKPEFGTLMIIAAFAFIYAIQEIVDVAQMMITNYPNELSIKEFLPQCADTLMLLVCCTFIAVILYNVSKRKIFDRLNSICIYGVGATIIFGSLLQRQLFGEDSTIPDSNVLIYYSLLGVFIIFFGKLFDIAVKLKKEQDLTI